MELLSAIAGYEWGAWNAAVEDRHRLYDVAAEAARRRGKKLLVVGKTKGRHDPGDVCIDIEPDADSVYGDVERLGLYGPKHFGAVLISHVLEHVRNPAAAWAELHRVADEVYVAYPDRSCLMAWLHPDHRWILLSVPQGAGAEPFAFMPNPFFRLVFGPVRAALQDAADRPVLPPAR